MNYKFTVLPFTTADDHTRAAFEMSEMEHAGYEVKGFSTRKGEITIAFRRKDAPVKAPTIGVPGLIDQLETLFEHELPSTFNGNGDFEISSEDWFDKVNACVQDLIACRKANAPMDAPAPTPAPVDPVHVDEAWWQTLFDLCSIWTREPSISQQEKAWEEVREHVRTYQGLPPDVIDAYRDLIDVASGKYTYAKESDAWARLMSMMTKYMPVEEGGDDA